MPGDQVYQAICAEVAKILRKERVRKGLTMTNVAGRAGLSQQMVSYVERGLRIPTLDTLLRIASAIDIHLPDVLEQAIQASRG